MERPWRKRAEELEEREGHFADLVAFREWFSAQDEKSTVDCDPLLELLESEPFADIKLYCILCDVFDSHASGGTA